MITYNDIQIIMYDKNNKEVNNGNIIKYFNIQEIYDDHPHMRIDIVGEWIQEKYIPEIIDNLFFLPNAKYYTIEDLRNIYSGFTYNEMFEYLKEDSGCIDVNSLEELLVIINGFTIIS